MSDQQDDWPYIRKATIDNLREMTEMLTSLRDATVEKEKAYTETSLRLQNSLQSHHDALYGFRNDQGEWVDGIISIVSVGEKRRKSFQRNVGYALAGMLTSVGVSLWTIVVKFSEYMAKHNT